MTFLAVTKIFQEHYLTSSVIEKNNWQPLCLIVQEENDIPSCDLSGFIRPSPVIVASPLSTFYRTSPEDGPIIPETQVWNFSEDVY